MRQDRENRAEVRTSRLGGIRLRALREIEEEPNERGDRAEPHVRHAYPEELPVHDRLQCFGCHRGALIGRGGIEIREDELLGKQDARQRTDGIEHLREVEPSYRSLRRSQREHVGIARRLQDGAPARHDEDARNVEPETLRNAGRHVQERPQNIHPQPHQHTEAIARLLNEQGCEERHHGISPVERDLHVSRRRLARHEDLLERRDEIVSHVVQHAPEREAAHERGEDRQITTRNDGICHGINLMRNSGVSDSIQRSAAILPRRMARVTWRSRAMKMSWRSG